jgi:glutaredoxin 3
MTTPQVEIYTKWTCGYCSRAKALLDSKNIAYTEYDVTSDAAKRAEMVERVPGAQTVPQIIIGGKPIGGCDDLSALDRAGKLDSLLGL